MYRYNVADCIVGTCLGCFASVVIESELESGEALKQQRLLSNVVGVRRGHKLRE